MEGWKWFRSVSKNGEITPGLFISVFASMYAALGYSGWLGETWVKEKHDRVALLGLVMGVCLLGYSYLERRAETIGSQRARRQFAAAAAALGIVGLVLMIGASVLGAAIVAAALIMFGAPWWRPSPPPGVDELSALLSIEPGILCLAGILVGTVIVAAAAEFVIRRFWMARVSHQETSAVGAWPELTVSIASNACLLSFGADTVQGCGV